MLDELIGGMFDGRKVAATGVADPCIGLPATVTGVRDSVAEDTVGTDTGETGSDGETVLENTAPDGVGGPTLLLGGNDELGSGNVTEAMLDGNRLEELGIVGMGFGVGSVTTMLSLGVGGIIEVLGSSDAEAALGEATEEISIEGDDGAKDWLGADGVELLPAETEALSMLGEGGWKLLLGKRAVAVGEATGGDTSAVLLLGATG